VVEQFFHLPSSIFIFYLFSSLLFSKTGTKRREEEIEDEDRR
jgi:hypothetical protein